MDFGYVIGWVGLVFAICIPIPQLVKTYRTKSVRDLNPLTNMLIVMWMACSIVYAVYIKDLIFIISQGFGLVINAILLALIIRYRITHKWL